MSGLAHEVLLCTIAFIVPSNFTWSIVQRMSPSKLSEGDRNHSSICGIYCSLLLLIQRKLPARDRNERYDSQLKRKCLEFEIFVQAVGVLHGAKSITSLLKV